MKQYIITKPLARALIVIAAVASIAGGVTYAALQSQAAVVQGSVIQTAVADLKLSTNGTTYSRSVEGFVFGALIPGGQAMPAAGHTVMLRNEGTTGLSLRVSANPSIANADGVNLAKVKVLLTDSDNKVASFTLKELIDSSATGGVIIPNISRMMTTQVLQYKVQVQFESDAVMTSSATISNFNLVFGAVAVN